MDDFVPEHDDDEDGVPQHEALSQLDGWRADAKAAVEANLAALALRRADDLPALIAQELLRTHRGDMEELLEELQRDRADLEARMESDRVNEVRPTQTDLDELEALNDAIIELEDALNV